jgi:hypothetical protein
VINKEGKTPIKKRQCCIYSKTQWQMLAPTYSHFKSSVLIYLINIKYKTVQLNTSKNSVDTMRLFAIVENKTQVALISMQTGFHLILL